jgi:hypothetical protein
MVNTSGLIQNRLLLQKVYEKMKMKICHRGENAMEENKEMLELARSIEKNGRKTLRNSRIQTLCAIVAAVCCAAVVILVMRMLPAVNGLMEQLETVLMNLEQVTQKLAALDLEGMVINVEELVSSGQESLEKINTIDMEVLNQAIQDLAKVIEPLARLFR